MQINSVIPVIPSKSAALPVEKLLGAILAAGLFRAIVVQRQNDSVLLDTPWGRIRGKGPDTLNRGDEVLARMENGRAGPGLKVVQHVPARVQVPAQNLQQVFNADATAPRVATVVERRDSTTVLAIDRNAYRVNGLPIFDRGDRLMLTPLTGQQVEVKRIDPQTMLKAALSVLLPRQADKGQQLNPRPMQELAQTISRGDVDRLLSQLAPALTRAAAPPGRPMPASDGEAKVMPDLARGERTAAETRIEPGRPLEPTTPARQLIRIASILRLLAAPLADMKSLDSGSLQRALQTLGMTPAPTSANPGQAQAPASLNLQLRGLLDALKQYPEALGQVVLRAVQQQAQGMTKSPIEQLPPGFEVALRHEVQQQAETLLGQVTAQKVMLNLQQENQQPLQLNLSLPLQAEQQTRELKLRIREKKRASENADESHWEIQLSFEFGLLGLITTRVQLHGQGVAAQFWAERRSTKALIDDNLGQLRAQLLRNGFEPGMLDCFHGNPTPMSEPDSPWPVSQNLLDLKA